MRSRNLLFGSTEAVERKWLKIYGGLRVVAAVLGMATVILRYSRMPLVGSPPLLPDLYQDYGGLYVGHQIHWSLILAFAVHFIPLVLKLVAGIGIFFLQRWIGMWLCWSWPAVFVLDVWATFYVTGGTFEHMSWLIERFVWNGLLAVCDFGYARPTIDRQFRGGK